MKSVRNSESFIFYFTSFQLKKERRRRKKKRKKKQLDFFETVQK